MTKRFLNLENATNNKKCNCFIISNTDAIESKNNFKKIKNLLNLKEGIQYSKNGKPFFKNNAIHFNISHSNTFWIITFAKNNIGIDIECITNADFINTLDSTFGVSTLQDWCAKEAVIKCLDLDIDVMGDIIAMETYAKYKYQNKIIFTYPIIIHENYIGFIASETENLEIGIENF